MRPPRIRRLSDEEILLWRAVADTVEARRPGSTLPVGVTPPVPPRPEAAPPQAAVPLVAPRPRASRMPPLADLDRRGRAKILRGHHGIERRIDLHGMTQADAHAALRGFLRRAQADDLRLVLVVTGKGERSRADPIREAGVLKRVVPHWLRALDLRGIVLGFEPAGIPHGGAGALYIRLRRARPAG